MDGESTQVQSRAYPFGKQDPWQDLCAGYVQGCVLVTVQL